MLGVYLGIKNAILMDIKRKNHQLPGSARKDMLMTWLDGGKATRAKFIEALKDMGYLRIVQEIESQNGNNKRLFYVSKIDVDNLTYIYIYNSLFTHDFNILLISFTKSITLI